ncbi:MAG TPA: ribosome-associated translation inhibitor RaiA [bacterium]|nr:ribosome-associated translation inhibitor RaiA [bacterium]
MKNMKMVIKGNNIKVTDSLRSYIEEKIGRLTKYYDKINSAEVELLYQDNKSAEETQRVEVTLGANGTIFRCEEASISMYASIDIVSEKLERQLRRYKQKSHGRTRGARKENIIDEQLDFDEVDIPEREPEIVKTKKFPVKPMTAKEACLQMEMLNHNFYVFLNADTDQVNVVYVRQDTDYGIIEPEFE